MRPDFVVGPGFQIVHNGGYESLTFADVLEFTVRPEHLKLIRRMYLNWNPCETGAPEVDPKRPYGNSSVAYDVAEICGIEIRHDKDDPDEEMEPEQRKQLLALHAETGIALSIILRVGSFEAATYRRTDKYSTAWERVTGGSPAGGGQ